MMKPYLLYFALFLPFFVLAQDAEADYQMHIKKIDAPIELDGVLDEGIWMTADKGKQFTYQFPVDTGFTKWQTEVQMAFDDKFLYVGVTCFERREDYTVQSLKRDFPGGTSDVINIIFDPSKDGLNGFLFAVSPLGVQREALVSNGNNLAYEWDNKWLSAVENYDDRWTVEMAIPFKTLRYSVSEGANSWNINFIRTKLKDWEVSTWYPVPTQFIPNNLAFMGRLNWETPPPSQGVGFSVIPYFTAGRSLDYKRDPNSLDLLKTLGKNTAGIGGDAKIAITPSLNLDLTINPDFSQVEVDQQVANLQRFELFFPERRQFFLENRDLFAMFGFPSTRPFFSRRIGLARNPLTGANEKVRIQGGARLSGKLNDKWRVGLLNMQTERVDWDSLNVLPAANFTVATLQRRLFSRSTISAIYVDKENFLGKLDETQRNNGNWKPWNRVAGLEYNLYSKDNRWEGEWYYHRSFSPDNDLEGQTYASFLGYNDRNLSVRFGHFYVDSKYNSDAGFVPRRSIQGLYPGMGWTFWPKSNVINSVAVGIDGDLTYNLDWEETDLDVAFGPEVGFKSQSEISAKAYMQRTFLFFPFDPTNLYKPGTTPLPANQRYTYYGFRGSWSTSSSYNLQSQVNITVGQFFNGHIGSVNGFLSYRLQPIGLFSLGYSYNRISLPAPYPSGNVFLLGPKVELSFSKSLFASGFFQYNTQANNFNINARLQWRFAPVSDLFLVYTDNSYAEGIQNTPIRFFTPKNRAIVLKAVYWLNL